MFAQRRLREHPSEDGLGSRQLGLHQHDVGEAQQRFQGLRDALVREEVVHLLEGHLVPNGPDILGVDAAYGSPSPRARLEDCAFKVKNSCFHPWWAGHEV